MIQLLRIIGALCTVAVPAAISSTTPPLSVMEGHEIESDPGPGPKWENGSPSQHPDLTGFY